MATEYKYLGMNLLNLVPYMPCVLRAVVLYIPLALRVLVPDVPDVPRVLRVIVPPVSRAARVLLLHIPHAPVSCASCPTCFRFSLALYPSCSPALYYTSISSGVSFPIFSHAFHVSGLLCFIISPI